MSQPNVAPQVGEAWGFLREGRYDDAGRIFDEVIHTIPNDVDAYYGLGLVYRASGKEGEAIESFQKALEIAKELLAVLRSQLGVNGEHVSSLEALETTQDDRYMMLIRMIRQRLAELGAKAT